MTGGRPVLARLARARYPKLLVLVVLGAVVGAVGLVLVVTGPQPRPGSLGARLAVLGALVFLFAGSGYLAFAVFDRGFD